MRPTLWCVFALLAAPAALASQDAVPTDTSVAGSVRGSVMLTARLSSRKPRARLESAYGAPAAPARPVNELVNVIVYLQTIPPHPTRPPSRFAIRQHHEAFAPHVLPVLMGDTVDFPNEDPFFHNVFSLSRAKTFDLGRYPTGASKAVGFDRPGVVQVFCHIHSDMRATVLVLENPYFTVADSAGRYVLTGVPPGEYRLVAWHERIRPAVRRVTIAAGTASTVDFAIPLPPEGDAP